MKIRMNSLMAGPNGTRHPGEVCVVSADEAEMLVSAGYAEAVEAEKAAAETADKDAEAVEAEKSTNTSKGKGK